VLKIYAFINVCETLKINEVQQIILQNETQKFIQFLYTINILVYCTSYLTVER